MNYPIIDLHCDLLAHMLDNPDPFDADGIGCSFPALAQGNVKLQVMAIYTATEKGSTDLAVKQSEIFASLIDKYPEDCELINSEKLLRQLASSPKLGMIAAIENASGFCEEDEPIEDGFNRLEQIISNVSRVLYIGMTHHPENRFGGGNNSSVGLKEDGEKLLQYLDGRKIAIDFSHTSDALAYDILAYIDEHRLNVPVLASHSNYRSVWKHNRNLPDDLARSIISRDGLIGVNFLRAFVNNDDHLALSEHISHGLTLGGRDAICFGADYFCTDKHPDRSRVPFYHPEHRDATCYPSLLDTVAEQVSSEILNGISSQNVINYLTKIWE